MKELILAFLEKREYQLESVEPKDEDFTILVFGFNQGEQIEFTLDTVYHNDLVDIFELLENGSCVYIDAKKMPLEEMQILNCLYGILHYQNFDKHVGHHTPIGQLVLEVTEEQSSYQQVIYDNVFISYAEHCESNFVGINFEMTILHNNLIENCMVLIPFCLLSFEIENKEGLLGIFEPMFNYLHHEELIYCLEYIDTHTTIKTDRKLDSQIIDKYKNFIQSYETYLGEDREKIYNAIKLIS